jgi:hypothetical protein
VLLVGLTPAVSELGKNIVLSGISVYLLDFGHIVDEMDYENNFYISFNDIGKEVKRINLES